MGECKQAFGDIRNQQDRQLTPSPTEMPAVEDD